ncbi:V-type ATP synthase subunit F [Treponema pectinovorum]|uniref:V-type ATP synthase subunit F n=1 Tax=Treponema pectinovorum TaxID=164 RepID=UPI0011CAF91B|nr:V-type ATP synthase subunit F [Treponema pectinovorum]
MEYFVIAQRELVLAFNLVGVHGQVALNRKEALQAFYRVTGRAVDNALPVDEHPKVLIISEDVSAMIEEEVVDWQKGAKFPLIVEIPPINGHLQGKKSLTDSIREAVGISV